MKQSHPAEDPYAANLQAMYVDYGDFVRGNLATSEMDLWRISPSGGQPERLTHHNAHVAFPAPINPHTVLYVAPAEDGSGPSLYAFNVDRKTSHRISFGLEQYLSVAASANGHRVVATARRVEVLDDLKARFPDTLRVTALDVTDEAACVAAVSGCTATLNQSTQSSGMPRSITFAATAPVPAPMAPPALPASASRASGSTGWQFRGYPGARAGR